MHRSLSKSFCNDGRLLEFDTKPKMDHGMEKSSMQTDQHVIFRTSAFNISAVLTSSQINLVNSKLLDLKIVPEINRCNRYLIKKEKGLVKICS